MKLTLAHTLSLLAALIQYQRHLEVLGSHMLFLFYGLMYLTSNVVLPFIIAG